MTNRTSLATLTAASYIDHDVNGAQHIGQVQRLIDNHHASFARKIFNSRFAVHRNDARTFFDEYTGNGAFIFAEEKSPVWKNLQTGYERVKALDYAKNKIVWLQPAPANNTWTIALRKDVALANTILTIPTAPDTASLNIAQSVVITAYEWFKAAAGEEAGILNTTSPLASPVNPEKFSPPASREEIEGFFDHLERLLDQTHFFKTEEIKPKMWRGLRSLFIRASMNEQEVRTLRGVLKSLENR